MSSSSAVFSFKTASAITSWTRLQAGESFVHTPARKSVTMLYNYLTLKNAFIVVTVASLQIMVLFWTTSQVIPKPICDTQGFVMKDLTPSAASPTIELLPRSVSKEVGTRDFVSFGGHNHPYKSPIGREGVDPNATCDQLMDHFHHVNNAFHRGDPSVAPPLINYGFYKGQGFGRLIDHSASHCLLSFSLDRPCLVDLSDRDPYYTWRSFIHRGTYDWEMDDRPALANLTRSVRTAIAALPQQEHGEWDEPVPHTDDLHLMEKLKWRGGKTDRKKYFRHIEPWRAENIPKALLSPNWGGAWFPDLSPPAYFGLCHRKELLVRIQNAMYKPTPLSRKLHAQRRFKVMKPPLRPYGAIHIRFVILQIEKMDDTEATLLPALEKCLQKAKEETGITDWWLISDKPSRAVALSKWLAKGLKIYFPPESRDDQEFRAHSNNPESRGLFGHAHMKISVLDWMVLHEASAAIVTRGSYGDTGARGQGKIPDPEGCGSFTLYHV